MASVGRIPEKADPVKVSVLSPNDTSLLTERRDPTQGTLLRAWHEGQVLLTFSGRILPVDVLVAQRCAKLHVPDPCSDRDALIAATALVHGMTVITRNIAAFQAIGVELLNPWDIR